MSEYLRLKWGTLKGWDVTGNDAAIVAIKKYHAEPTAFGVMQQHDTETQVEALCELIDAMNGPITNDWTGEQMTKDEAKQYVREYRRPS